MTLLKKVEKLVERNSIDEALNELERHITSNYYYLKTEIVLLKSRVSDIKSRRNSGIIDLQEEQITLNQIKHSILDIAKQLNEEAQDVVLKQNLEIKVVDKYKSKSIIMEYLEFLRPSYIFPVLICLGIITLLSKVVKTNNETEKHLASLFPQKYDMDAKFNVLIDKNKFHEAEILIDSIYQSNPEQFDRESKRKQIFSKQIDYFLTKNEPDSILLMFKNYRLRTIFPDERKPDDEKNDYNVETVWINDEIEKVIIRLCKVDKSKAYTLIESYFRPKGVSYECGVGNSRENNCKFYKDYSRKGKLADMVKDCQ